jgi:hypothetical protein
MWAERNLGQGGTQAGGAAEGETPAYEFDHVGRLRVVLKQNVWMQHTKK